MMRVAYVEKSEKIGGVGERPHARFPTSGGFAAIEKFLVIFEVVVCPLAASVELDVPLLGLVQEGPPPRSDTTARRRASELGHNLVTNFNLVTDVRFSFDLPKVRMTSGVALRSN